MMMNRQQSIAIPNLKHLLNECMILRLAQSFINHDEKHLFSFKKVHWESDWQSLGEFRLRHYRERKAYLLETLTATGLDAIDARSDVYIARFADEIVATIRLTPYPFETCELIQASQLEKFLGNHYQTEYLEWSRLLIKGKAAPGLMPAMIVFAGMQTLLHTEYSKYFGYATPVVRKLFSRFLIMNETLTFQIPTRGMHIYTLLKGNFLNDLAHLSK